MSQIIQVAILVSLGLLAFNSALAGDQDVDALLLADTAPAAVESASNWKTFVEGAFGGFTRRDGNQTRHDQRLSLDVQYDNSFAPGWRAVFADRLDMNWPAQVNDENSINTVKEAYLSWQARPDAILDLGRINVRYGVATGYNPTDYFRGGALRSIVSVDPASLKENRQGSVMLHGQSLWDGGSVTALYSPELSDRTSSNAFNPDWGATNNQNRWLVAISQKISDDINPQFLIYQEEKLPLQFGLNLTVLVSDATVIYFEWSGGHSPSLLTQALNQATLATSHDSQFRNRVSAGLTYTMSNKISLTAELEYNGGGLDKANWKALGRGSPLIYGQYRNWLQIVQEPPTKQAVFFYGRWQDALINHLDLSAMEHFDAVDSSRLYWLEARYHLEHAEFAVQWQRYSGGLFSDYGAAPKSQSWQALLRYYF
ncbi:conserved exported protein of unknown function [Georgfuchsia toluolica]|uniref:Alginate export domain-containing protein n=1 Tax=Georgfuchsia toluolica TaxID=424218 RepID=A0A916J962_9PROT|nr:hypothetical protein [Georgfuchsia toluolica]CAG4884646.1 conserved exported protein of unknown function [Georgfuchsia toluolica]